jgi:hypothetical protein
MPSIAKALSLLTAASMLLLAAGCGESSSKPPASARDITCQEVKASTKQANALAQQVVTDIKSVTGGGVVVSFEFASRRVSEACAKAKSSDKVYLIAARGVGVSPPIVAALAKKH